MDFGTTTYQREFASIHNLRGEMAEVFDSYQPFFKHAQSQSEYIAKFSEQLTSAAETFRKHLEPISDLGEKLHKFSQRIMPPLKVMGGSLADELMRDIDQETKPASYSIIVPDKIVTPIKRPAPHWDIERMVIQKRTEGFLVYNVMVEGNPNSQHGLLLSFLCTHIGIQGIARYEAIEDFFRANNLEPLYGDQMKARIRNARDSMFRFIKIPKKLSNNTPIIEIIRNVGLRFNNELFTP